MGRAPRGTVVEGAGDHGHGDLAERPAAAAGVAAQQDERLVHVQAALFGPPPSSDRTSGHPPLVRAPLALGDVRLSVGSNSTPRVLLQKTLRVAPEAAESADGGGSVERE
jgi:hypothetical protein